MRTLWLPHTTPGSDGWEGSRHYHLFRQLHNRHDLHWVSWQRTKNPLELGHWTQESQAEGTQYTIRLAPNIYRILGSEYPKNWHILHNQSPFRRALKQIIRQVQPDVIVYSSSHHVTGFPPFDVKVPIVFDYLDKAPEFVEKAFVSNANVTIAISHKLAQSIPYCKPPPVVIPNGVDQERYASVSRAEAKARLGLEGFTVVSLIGLTCSPTLYFLEAVASMQRKIPNLCLLVVGAGKTRDDIVNRAGELKIKHVHAPGSIPNTEVHWHFAATDVGLYPGEDIPYYREASPLKVVEYTAAGAQVVSSTVDMFRDGWPNVRLVGADAKAFERGITSALTCPRVPPNVTGYDWVMLAARIETALRTACKSRGTL